MRVTVLVLVFEVSIPLVSFVSRCIITIESYFRASTSVEVPIFPYRRVPTGLRNKQFYLRLVLTARSGLFAGAAAAHSAVDAIGHMEPVRLLTHGIVRLRLVRVTGQNGIMKEMNKMGSQEG